MAIFQLAMNHLKSDVNMKAELKSLQEKTLKLVTMYLKACQENSRLHKELDDAHSQNQELNEKIAAAKHRLEKLLVNISDHESS